MKSAKTNRFKIPRKIFKYLLLLSLPLIMSFTLRGCEFLNQLFSAANYGTNKGYNDVVKGLNIYYYITNGGNIYGYSGFEDDPWELLFTVPGNPDLLDAEDDFPWSSPICVGNNGTIVRKRLNDWEVLLSNVNVTLNKILVDYPSQTSSGDLYFVIGDNGTVLKSTNRGDDWTKINFPTTDNLYDITENSEHKIFVSGENYCFYSTMDDGDTWNPEGIGINNITRSGPFSSYNKIYFYDNNAGYVGGPYGLILKTTDGGLSWKFRSASGFDEVNDLFFISPDSGVSVGPNGIARLTTDGGDNWFEDDGLTAFLNGETIKKIVPFGKNHGLVIGENGFDIFVAKDSTYLDSLPLVTSVKYQNILVEELKLEQNYPNPFNPTTTIKYTILESGLVTLKVYNLIGEEIASLINEEKGMGSYEVEFDALALPSGIYYYRLQSGDYIETKKMVLLR